MPQAVADPVAETCGACGQPIPAADIVANRQAVEERANADKASTA